MAINLIILIRKGQTLTYPLKKRWTQHPPLRRLCRNRKQRGEAVRFQSFRMRVFYIMGNRRMYKIGCFHIVGTLHSDRVKVTALNLFHPTTSPPFRKVGFFILRHSLLTGRDKGEGESCQLFKVVEYHRGRN